jgi:hypothetical protein
LQPGSSFIAGSLTLAAAAETLPNGSLIGGPPSHLLDVMPDYLRTLTMESETELCNQALTRACPPDVAETVLPLVR